MNIKYIILDLETESKEVFGRTANFKYNKIVCWTTKTSNEMKTNYSLDKDLKDEVGEVIKGSKVLVAHNAKFEMLHIYESEKFQEFLKQGNQIFCTQLAEYFLESLQAQFAGLRDIAVNKYNCQEREKYIEDFFDKGYNTEDIPEELIIEDNINDVLDTEKIYLRQFYEIKKKGKVFEELLNIQNNFLIATTEMEYNGIFIDKEVLEENKAELEEELKTYEADLERLIKKYWRIESV